MKTPPRVVLEISDLWAPRPKAYCLRWRLLVSLTLCLSSLLLAPSASAQVSLTALGTPVNENFDTLASSGTSILLPTGWAFLETGTAANTTYAAGTGSLNTGNIYSFGTTAERALGTLRSGSLIPTIGAAFTNDTGSTATALDIAYTGEEWRLGATGRQDRLDFQYSLNATSLSTGTWIDVDPLDFSTPVTTAAVGATIGNDPQFRTPLQALISGLSIPAGATFWIRWTDLDPAGSDDGLAVDDFSLTATQVDPPPAVLSSSPANGASNVALNASLSVTFTEPVTLSPNWVDVTCSVSGVHALTTSGGPTTFNVDPSLVFSPSEQCVLSVFGSEVTGQAPPNAGMLGNYSATFTTAAASACGLPATPIHTIQGSGTASTMLGSVVSVEGVVVGDFQGTAGQSGFFVQEEAVDADASPSTSEGIFVFENGAGTPVAVGDVVRVTGSVAEAFELTELNDITAVEVCASGASVTPTPVTLPVASASVLESTEGMLVTLNQGLYVSETFTLGRFGEVLLSANARLSTATNVVAPGAAATAYEAANVLASIQLDDGSNVQNPLIPPYLAADNTLRIGDRSGTLTGVMSFAFSTYELHSTQPVAFTRTNSRPAAPPSFAGALRVAAFNVLNYFTTLDTGGTPCGPSGGLECRGANSASEFQRQRAKILAALSTINADVVGLIELENNASASIADLVSGLNALLGAGTYAFVNTGSIGTDAIKVGLIYKPATVELVGSFAILNSAVDPAFIDTLNRPVLAQTVRGRSNGEVFTVAVNHLKSKGSACSGDPDVGDGQGNCNLTRLAAAQAEAAWLADDPTNSGDPDILIVGDLNAYALENPISALTSAGYSNLIATFAGAAAYSYVFQGRSGYLDHGLASSSLAAKVVGAAEWHINADEPIVLDYNQEFNPAFLYQPDAFRSSDHDPLVVGIGGAAAVPPVPLPRSSGLWTGAALLGLGLLMLASRRSGR